MNVIPIWYPGDQVAIWGINVLLQVTLVASLAMLAARCLRRDPVVRSWILCSALLIVLVSPVTSILMQTTELNLLSVTLFQPADPAATNSGRNGIAVVDAVDGAGNAEETHNTTFRSAAEPPAHFPTTEPRVDGGFVRHSRSPGNMSPQKPTNFLKLSAERDTPQPAETPTDRSGVISIGALLRITMSILLPIWLVGFLAFLVRFLRGWCKLAIVLRSAELVTDERLGVIVSEAGRYLGTARIPKIVGSLEVAGPIVAGIRRPVLILPDGMLSQISRRQLSHVVVHEVAHALRHDPAIALVQNLVAAFFWLHPLVHSLNAQVARAREEVCDNHVLHITDPLSYSRTLLRLAELIKRRDPFPGTAGLMTSSWRLEERVAGILDSRRNPMTRLTKRRMALVINLSLLLGATAILSTFTLAQSDGDKQSGVESTTTDSSKELLERIIDAITTNYSQLETVQMTLEHLTINPRVERYQAKTFDRGETKLTIIEAPVFIRRDELVLRGQDLRCDHYERFKGDWKKTQITIRRGDSWAFYHLETPALKSERKWAEIMPTQKLGHLHPFDPREFGGTHQTHGMLRQLRTMRIVDVLARQGDLLRIRTEVAHKVEDGGQVGQQYEYTFDPSRNYLPTRVISFWDGKILGVTEIGYQEAIPGNAWFLREATMKWFGKKRADEIESRDWTQMITYRIVGRLRVNEPVDDELFTLEIPEGTRVVDQLSDKKVAEKVYYIRKPSLRFLSWLHDPPASAEEPLPGTYWRPSGEPVVDQGVLAPLHRIRGWQPERQLGVLHVFISHDDFIAGPFGSIDLLAAGGTVIDEFRDYTPRAVMFASPQAGNGWMMFQIEPPNGAQLPEAATIRFRYTAGEWGEVAAIAPDEQPGNSPVGGVTVLTVGETEEDKALVLLIIAKEQASTFQYGVFATRAADGGRLRPDGVTSIRNSDADHILTFEFPEPLTSYTEFTLARRRIREIHFRDVSLRPKQAE